MALFRGFIAVDVDVSSNILDFIEEISKSGANVKLVEPENIHITLKFLGDTKEDLIDDITNITRDSVAGVKPFKIRLVGTGVFPNENYIRVVWIGIKDSEIIAEIANRIDDRLSSLGFKKERRGFSAHLTIGRVRTAENKENLLNIINKYSDLEFCSLDVSSINLVKSDLTPKGPIYTTLKEVKLV